MQTSTCYQIAISSLYTVVLAGAAIGCQVNLPDPPVDREVSFATEIQPIFTQRCADCHSDGGLADNQGIPMRLVEGLTLDSIVNQPSSQDSGLTLVIPSDAANSLLFLKVSENDPPIGSTMPLIGEMLPSGELGLIRDWIDQGAMDN